MKNLLGKFKLNKLELDNQKILLIILAALVVICLDFAFLIKSQVQGIGNAGRKIIELKKDMDALTKDLNMIQQGRIKEKVSLASKQQEMISEGEIPQLLSDISSIANKNNVKIMQIKPSKDLKAKDKTYQGQKVTCVLITLDLLSDYHNLGIFINELENGKIFIAVDKIKISFSPGDYSQQKVDLVLKTYVKK